MKTLVECHKVLEEYFGPDFLVPYENDLGDLLHSFLLALEECEIITNEQRNIASHKIYEIEHPEFL